MNSTYMCREREAVPSPSSSLLDQLRILHHKTIPIETIVDPKKHATALLVLQDDKKSQRHEREDKEAWNLCLPIQHRRRCPHPCPHGSHEELMQAILLNINNNNSKNTTRLNRMMTPCMPSVLDLLLHEIYKGARDTQCVVLLTHGTLLGAYRNRTILPHTEDVDLVVPDFRHCIGKGTGPLAEVLWERGVYVFLRSGVYSACVTAKHPLAAYLYHSQAPIVDKPYVVPYADLYYRVDKDKTTSCMEVNGHQYPTYANPASKLEGWYGPTFMETTGNGCQDYVPVR